MFLTFAFLTIANVAWAISHYCSKYNQAKFDNDLKRDLLQHGMSADDIVKVLQASSATSSSRHERSRAEEPQELAEANV